jgi:transcriptional regulator with XRE-family HTH domain
MSGSVAERVRRLLAKRGLTQLWLSQHSEIPQGHVSNLLRGSRRFQRWHVLKFAAALGVTERDLLPPEAPPTGPAEPLPPAHGAAPRDRVPSEAVSVPGASVPSVRRLPPGLEGFLGRHGRYISEHEQDLLKRSGFSTDRTVRFDDDFWWGVLKLIRKHFVGPDEGGSAGD